MIRQQALERINDLSNEVHSLVMKRFTSGGDLLAWEARLISANVTEAIDIIGEENALNFLPPSMHRFCGRGAFYRREIID